MLKDRGIEDLPEVCLLDAAEVSRASTLRRKGAVALRKHAVMPPSVATRVTSGEAQRQALAERKAIAIAQVLHAWGVLDGLSHEEQEGLIHDLVEVALFELGL